MPNISIFISLFLLQNQGTQILPFHHRLVKDHEAACHSASVEGTAGQQKFKPYSILIT